jgi:hypothetical protein
MSAHHGLMTSQEPRSGRRTSPDPELYDSPRAHRAREKGLPGPYITGGEAPDEKEALAEERRLGRWLVLMVAVIVAAGFVLGLIAALLGIAVAQ